MVLPQNEDETGGYFALATVLNQPGQSPVHVDTTFLGMIYQVEHNDDWVVVHGSATPWGDEERVTYSWAASGLIEVSRALINLDEIPFPSDRQQYFEYNLENSRFGDAGAVDNPLVLTQSFLGSDSTQNHYSNFDVLSADNDRMVIGYDQKRLGDDSVYAKRYRLEFVPDGHQWHIDWIGQQFSCQPGRGRQAWHSNLCS